jgi:RNA polymerase sigma-70 factor, ECF subfamily
MIAHRRLYAVILRILRDHALAEDALQEVFLKIWRRAGRYNAEAGAPLMWMAVIARNTALDFVRASKTVIDPRVLAPDLETVEITEPSDRNLEKALKALPVEQASALILMHTYGFSHSELANHMKVPLGTAKSWVRRGTESLRVLLGV